MSLMEAGRVCVITAGRDAGKEVVIKEVKDKHFVTISGEHVKERRCNVKHLEPTGSKGKKATGKTVKQKQKAARPKKTRKTKNTAKKAPAHKAEKKPVKKESKQQ